MLVASGGDSTVKHAGAVRETSPGGSQVGLGGLSTCVGLQERLWETSGWERLETSCSPPINDKCLGGAQLTLQEHTRRSSQFAAE